MRYAKYLKTDAFQAMILKNIIICDWHYERADKTPVYFAMKGLNVITCPWRVPSLAVQQPEDMVKFRKESTKEMQPRFYGMMQTVWSDAASFPDGFYGNKKDDKGGDSTPWSNFRALYEKINSFK